MCLHFVVEITFAAHVAVVLSLHGVLLEHICLIVLLNVSEHLLAKLLLFDLHGLACVLSHNIPFKRVKLNIFFEFVGVGLVVAEHVLFSLLLCKELYLVSGGQGVVVV